MNRPFPVDRNLLQELNFKSIGQELREEIAYEKNSKSARSLVRGKELTIVLVALKEGAKLKEHHAAGPATALVLEGAINFFCPDQGKTFHLAALQSVVFSSAIDHSVEAQKDSLLLVVFGQRE